MWSWARQLLLPRWKAAVSDVQTLQRQQIKLHLNMIYVHEVTFLGAPSESLDESARRKGHTHYTQLHPWIAAFPKTTFVLVHWSLRYSRDDVLAFFDAEYGGVPKNVVLWI